MTGRYDKYQGDDRSGYDYNDSNYTEGQTFYNKKKTPKKKAKKAAPKPKRLPGEKRKAPNEYQVKITRSVLPSTALALKGYKTYNCSSESHMIDEAVAEYKAKRDELMKQKRALTKEHR